jgi:hypothetical protein
MSYKPIDGTLFHQPGNSLAVFSINPSMKSIALSLAFVSAVAAQRTFNVFNNWCVVS